MAPANDVSRLSLARRIDELGDRFEKQWLAGAKPRLEDFVASLPEVQRPQALAALLAVELELMRRAGSSPAEATYRKRFPNYAAVVSEVFATRSAKKAGETAVGRDSAETGPMHPSPPLSLDPEPIVSSIGRFQVVNVLGEGAFGRVYRARDPQLGRDVAIKVPFDAAVRTAIDRDRFLREARAAAGIHHPNVCPVHEVGEADGKPYIVMAMIPGQSLSAMLKSRKEPLPQKQAAVIVRKLALALEAAHKNGVVHRDLKPANVMFDRERKDVVVTDFGLARGPRLTDMQETQSGVIMGTPAYMSPEQARGDSKAVGPAADIYSLGVILYELLAGCRPFAGSVTEVIGQILHVEPESPSKHRSGIDPQLETACLIAMAKDPTARFSSMREFASALDGVLRPPTAPANETAKATKTKKGSDESSTDSRRLADIFAAYSAEQKEETAAAVEKAVLKAHTPRWVFVVFGIVMLGGLSAVAGIVFFNKNKSDTANVTIELKGIDLSDKSLSYTLDGKPISAEELSKPIELKVGEHELVVYKGKDPIRRMLFAVSGGRNPRIEYRPVEEPVVIPPVKKKEVTPTPIPKPKESPPPPETSEGWKGLELVHTLTHNDIVPDAAFSADSKKVITIVWSGPDATKHKIQTWDAQTGKRDGEPLTGLTHATRLVVNGTRWVFGIYGSDYSFDNPIPAQCWVWDPVKGIGEHKFDLGPRTPGFVHSLEVSGDGKTVLAAWWHDGPWRGDGAWLRKAYETFQNTVVLRDIATRDSLLKITGTTACFANDNKTILVGVLNDIKQIDIATQMVTRPLKKHTEAVWCVACSPDGRYAVSGSIAPSNAVVLWDLSTPDGNPVVLGRHGKMVKCVAFSPGGRTVVTGGEDGMIRLWDVVEKKEIAAYQAHSNLFMNLRFSPDGTLVVSSSFDATAKVWKLTKVAPAPIDPKPPKVPPVVLPPVGPSDGYKGLDLVTTLPHKGTVSDALFTSDGTQLLTACYLGEPPLPDGAGVHTWDTKTWKPVGTPVRLANVSKIAPNKSKWVFGVNGNGGLGVPSRVEIVVWNSTKGARDTKFAFDGENPGNFISLEALPDGKSVLASRWTQIGGKSETAIFDLGTGEFKLKVNGYASCLANDGKTILVGDKEELKQIEIAAGKVTRTLKKHTRHVACVACSPDGRFAASSSDGPANEIILWDLAAPDGDPIVLPQQKAYAYCLAFSPNGKSLLSGSSEGVLKLWDVVERKEVAAVRADEKWVWSARFSPDGTHAVTGGQGDTAAKVWKLTKGGEAAPSPPEAKSEAGEVRSWGAAGIVTDLFYHPDGKQFGAISAIVDPFQKRPNDVGLCAQHTYDLNAPQHKSHAWTSGEAIRVATVNAELGLCFSTDPRQPSTVRYICLFTAGGFNAADSHRPIPANHYAHLTKASGDGTRLLWSLTNQTTDTPSGEIRLESITVEKKWTVTLKELRRFPGTVACFEPKGHRVLVANGRSLALYEEGMPKPVAVYLGATAEITSVAMSPEGDRVVAAQRGGAIHVWDRANRKLTTTVKDQGHAKAMHAIAFTPDGRRFVTAGGDKFVRGWETATGKEVFKYLHEGPVYTLAMAPDGKRVLAGGFDKTIRLWQMPEAP